MIRSAWFNVVLYASALWFSLRVIMHPELGREHSFAMGQAWARVSLRALRRICRVEIDVRGLANLPAGGGLIAAQHQSALDILVPLYVLKRELLDLPFFGAALRRAGMIAVDRDGGAAALRRVVAECRAAVAEGRQIIIFPEGTRMAPGARARLQPGVVAIAKAVGVEITLARTNSGTHWSRNAFLKTPGRVRVSIEPAIAPTLTRGEILQRIEDCFYGGET
jgi:1-acyl-sn-glycerol-3-phosphate acyltransferase